MTGTDIKKNQELARREKGKPLGKWRDSHIILLVLPFVLTILFPVGGVYYLCGRFSPRVFSFANICMVYPVVIIFIFWCFFSGIVKLTGRRGKYTTSEKLIIIAETSIPLIFVSLLVSPFMFVERLGMSRLGMGLVGVGLRHRVESEVDIAATRAWLKSLDPKDYVDYYHPRIHGDDLPKSLRGMKDARASLTIEEDATPKAISLWWGGTPSGHWGIVIGMKDMETPPSESVPLIRTVVPVEPGVYVWWGE